MELSKKPGCSMFWAQCTQFGSVNMVKYHRPRIHDIFDNLLGSQTQNLAVRNEK